MSETYHCKGILKPTNIDTENFSEEDFETYRENSFIVANGEIYEPTYEINQIFDGDLSIFEEDSDGSFKFECVFYDGATWIGEILKEHLEGS